MCALMCYKTALLTECLLTNFTAIRMLTTMYALMFYKIALTTECLTTVVQAFPRPYLNDSVLS